jgi:hypothetical protein
MVIVANGAFCELRIFWYLFYHLATSTTHLTDFLVFISHPDID